MASGRAKPNSQQVVLADVDGYEEPGVVIEHALATIRGPLYRFFAEMFAKSPQAESRWKAIRRKRSETQQGRLAEATRRLSPDSRALLADIAKLRADFTSAVVDRHTLPQEQTRVLHERIAGRRDIDFLRLCNQAPHGTPINCGDAAEVVDTLANLAEAVGSPVEALKIRNTANVLELRAEWHPRHGGSINSSVKSTVSCVGVHWVQPRRVVPGSWWVVTLCEGGTIEVRADQQSADVVRYLTQELEGPVMAGLAFCFSAPRRFLTREGLDEPAALWSWCRQFAGSEDRSLTTDDLPEDFHIVDERDRAALRTPRHSPQDFRETEREVADRLGVNPASILDVGGDGSVGALALKGMPMLTDLRSAGAHIWPFDPADLEGSSVTCVEIFPRSLWTSVFPDECPKSKKNRMRRWNFVADIEANDGVLLPPARATAVANDERAFDALLTAWALRRYSANVLKLPRDSDADRLEGQIWTPDRRPLKRSAGREGPGLTC